MRSSSVLRLSLRIGKMNFCILLDLQLISRKWIGSERLYILCMNVKGKEAKAMIENYQYMYNKRKCVLILSYEVYIIETTI